MTSAGGRQYSAMQVIRGWDILKIKQVRVSSPASALQIQHKAFYLIERKSTASTNSKDDGVKSHHGRRDFGAGC